MDWDKVLEFLTTWGPWILAVVFAVVSWVLRNKVNGQGWREVCAILLGDIVATVLQAAHGEVDNVSEAMVRDAAAVTYERLTALLPPKWHDLIVGVVSKGEFCDWAWQAWQNWKATLDMPAATRALPV
jgi:hypothetical protein